MILFLVGHSSCPDKIEFPIKEDFADKRSYITPTVAWARNEFIQTDLTKLFQKARRLPGKGSPLSVRTRPDRHGGRNLFIFEMLRTNGSGKILDKIDKRCFIVN